MHPPLALLREISGCHLLEVSSWSERANKLQIEFEVSLFTGKKVKVRVEFFTNVFPDTFVQLLRLHKDGFCGRGGEAERRDRNCRA